MQQILTIICSVTVWGELKQVQLAPLIIFTMLIIIGHTSFYIKVHIFLN